MVVDRSPGRSPSRDDTKPKVAYRTRLGRAYQGSAESYLRSAATRRLLGKVQLILTSPPFPLNRAKRYGNARAEDYEEWLRKFARLFKQLLRRNGSVVIELGNAWQPGRPVMSTLAIRSLLAFQEEGGFNLCQQFIYFNPARLPTPAQWVNVERIRVKDAYTNLWWMSPSTRPKADNRNVLREYSSAMKHLLTSRSYNSGTRPSEHRIGRFSFLRDNGGAIPPNVLVYPNTKSSTSYQEYCRRKRLGLHPARMPVEVAEFFINFLTDPRDLVFDPFAGSNTTGYAAAKLGRRWISVELDKDYVRGSRGWFARR